MSKSPENLAGNVDLLNRIWDTLVVYGFGSELRQLVEKKIFPHLSEAEQDVLAGWLEMIFQLAGGSFRNPAFAGRGTWRTSEEQDSFIRRWQEKKELRGVNFRQLLGDFLAESIAYFQKKHPIDEDGKPRPPAEIAPAVQRTVNAALREGKGVFQQITFGEKASA